MISAYLKPDSMQVVRGRLQKEGLLDLQQCEEASFPHTGASYLDILQRRGEMPREEAVQKFSYFFEDVQEMAGGRRDSICLVLPDFLFALVDCFQYESEADMEQQIAGLLGSRALAEVYYSVPIRTSPAPQEHCATVYAMERDMVDLIVEAAGRANARLYSIEAASLSFLRASGRFRKEEYVLQSFERQATLIGYSSIAGLFKMDMPELSLGNLGNMDQEAADALIRSSMVQFESTAEQTFTDINQDIPYTFLANPVLVRAMPAFMERAGKAQAFPPFIRSELEASRQEGWMCAAGTLLQSVAFPDDRYPAEMDDYEKIGSGNVLPEDVQKNTKAYQLIGRLKRGSLIAMGCLVALLACESAGILALSSVEVPASLQADYAEAQKSSQELDREIDIIRQAGAEHQYPMEAMEALLENRPDGLSFLSVTIGSEGKNADAQWIRLKVAARDPLFFQGYLSSLQDDGRLEGAAISQIDANNASGMKTADLVIGKEKVTE